MLLPFRQGVLLAIRYEVVYVGGVKRAFKLSSENNFDAIRRNSRKSRRMNSQNLYARIEAIASLAADRPNLHGPRRSGVSSAHLLART